MARPAGCGARLEPKDCVKYILPIAFIRSIAFALDGFDTGRSSELADRSRDSKNASIAKLLARTIQSQEPVRDPDRCIIAQRSVLTAMTREPISVQRRCRPNRANRLGGQPRG